MKLKKTSKHPTEVIVDYLREKDKEQLKLRKDELQLQREPFEAQREERQGMLQLMNAMMNRLQ